MLLHMIMFGLLPFLDFSCPFPSSCLICQLVTFLPRCICISNCYSPHLFCTDPDCMWLLLAYTRLIWGAYSCTCKGGLQVLPLNLRAAGLVRPRPHGKIPSLLFSLLFGFICKFLGLMLAPRGKVSVSPLALSTALTLHLALLQSIFQLRILYLTCTEDVATLELNLCLT